jgi:hypothetical protein
MNPLYQERVYRPNFGLIDHKSSRPRCVIGVLGQLRRWVLDLTE